MDFRALDPKSVTWKEVRGRLTPTSPLRFQTPVTKCIIRDVKQYQQITMECDDGETCASFTQFIRDIEDTARDVVCKDRVSWISCINTRNELRINGFDGVLYFDVDGRVVDNPLHFKSCACLLELAGIWTTQDMVTHETRAGLRCKVIQLKEQRMEAPYLFNDENDDADMVVVHPTAAPENNADSSGGGGGGGGGGEWKRRRTTHHHQVYLFDDGDDDDV